MKIFETKSFTYFNPTLDENVKESIVTWPFSATGDIAKDFFFSLFRQIVPKSHTFSRVWTNNKIDVLKWVYLTCRTMHIAQSKGLYSIKTPYAILHNKFSLERLTLGYYLLSSPLDRNLFQSNTVYLVAFQKYSKVIIICCHWRL